MTELLVGSDHRTLITSLPSPAASGTATTSVPAGLLHGVPSGSRVALCGEAPAIVWTGLIWPGQASLAELCETCRILERARRRAV